MGDAREPGAQPRVGMRIVLCVATVTFIALGGGLTIARGHLFGDVVILLLAPVLALTMTVAARATSRAS